MKRLKKNDHVESRDIEGRFAMAKIVATKPTPTFTVKVFQSRRSSSISHPFLNVIPIFLTDTEGSQEMTAISHLVSGALLRL